MEAPDSTMWTLPMGAQRNEDTETSTLSSEMELALTLLSFTKADTRPQYVSKLYWPFVMAPLDDLHCALIDLLGSHQTIVQEFPSPDCIELLENFPDFAPSIDRTAEFLDQLAPLSDSPPYSPEPCEHDMKGCLALAQFTPGISELLSLVFPARNIANEEILTPHLAFREGQIVAANIRALWQKCSGDASQLSASITTIESTEKAWRALFVAKKTEVEKRYADTIAKVRPGVDERIQEAQHLMDKEIHGIDVKLSPEISLLEAEVTKLERDAERLVTTGKENRRLQRSTATAHQKAEAQLSRMIDERDRLISKVQRHYGETIAREEEKIRAIEASRDAETAPFSDAEQALAAACTRALNVLQSSLAERQTHLASILPIVAEVPANVGRKFQGVSAPLLVPFWIAGFRHSSPSQIRIAFPSFVGWAPRFRDRCRGLFTGESIPRTPTVKTFARNLRAELGRVTHSDPQVLLDLRSQGAEQNVLQSPSFPSELRKGIEELHKRRWITRTKALRLLAIYAA